jgi:DNA-binding response OmpR family regulator
VTRRSAILCVDDEPNILALRSALLGMAGYKVHVAKDGRTALEIFRNEPIDLVVLDYDMPGMTGDNVAKEMRHLRKDVPLLLVTAFHDLPATCTSIFDATVVKGDAPTVLLDKISSLLGGAPVMAHSNRITLAI